jgi:hypothetical protein
MIGGSDDKAFVMLFETFKKKTKMLEDVSVDDFVGFDNERMCERQLTVPECVEIAREYVRRFSLTRKGGLGIEKEEEKEGGKNDEERKGKAVAVAAGKEGAEPVADKQDAKTVLGTVAELKKQLQLKGASLEELKAVSVLEAAFSPKLVQKTTISDFFARRTEKVNLDGLKQALESIPESSGGAEDNDEEEDYESAVGYDEETVEGEQNMEAGEEGKWSDGGAIDFNDQYGVGHIDADYEPVIDEEEDDGEPVIDAEGDDGGEEEEEGEEDQE